MGLRKRSQETDAEELGDAGSFAAESSIAGTVTPLDVQQKEFGVSRFGGYKMRDVDVFLDQLTDALSALIAENERLRGSGADTPDLAGSGAAQIRRQAEEQLARARAEADRILTEARERSTTSLAASALGGQNRAAVDAFLAQERAFLQGLGRLVQQHTDSVKQMARSSRQPAPEAVPAAKPVTEPVEPKPEANAEQPEPAAEAMPQVNPRTASVVRPPVPDRVDAAPARQAEAPKRPPQPPTEPIRIDEAEPISARRQQPEDTPAPGSLKELFWGEDA